jgi:murein L,D-transpeptidase YafK
VWLFLIISASAFSQSDFKTQQLTYSRVREAYQEKETQVKQGFAAKNIDLTKANLLFRAFKHDKILEVWAKPHSKNTYELISTYPVCAISGNLGPKRKEGDHQIPEGFYYIDRFNPQSNFYLSLGINYPNASDKLLGVKGKLGGDIFIHGNCVTVGCLPMTDDYIKELYIMAVEARNNGQQQIPVHIFPAKMNKYTLDRMVHTFSADGTTAAFWANLQKGYYLFENTRQLPTVLITSQGAYTYK